MGGTRQSSKCRELSTPNTEITLLSFCDRKTKQFLKLTEDFTIQAVTDAQTTSRGGKCLGKCTKGTPASTSPSN